MIPTNVSRPSAELSPTLDDPRLSQALEEYLEQLEGGQAPDRQEFLARHADLAAVLAGCLDGLEVLHARAPHLVPLSGVLRPPPTPGAADIQPLGDFRILREVGRGGMGVVYEAIQLSLGRRVALKVLPFAAALDPKQLQRFKNEAQAAAHLHHTNIVPVFAVGCERGVYYYAMQFIEGRTVAALIRELRQPEENEDRESKIEDRESKIEDRESKIEDRESKIEDRESKIEDRESKIEDRESKIEDRESKIDGTVRRDLPSSTAQAGAATRTTRSSILDPPSSFFHAMAQLGVQAAEGLEHAHQQGVVHRDVKPANLLLDDQDHVWITDFGLARCRNDASLTTTGDLVGTLRYMSPEQALGKRGPVDHRTDIYALGATLYELLTREPVFPGSDRNELLRQIAHDEPRPLRSRRKDIPRELETIVLKALGKGADERYATAQDLADDLRRFLEDRPILARRPTLRDKTAKWLRRHRSVAVSAVVVLLLAVVSLAVSTVLIAQEQARTRAAFEAEAVQRTRAEENFRQARRAVDYFTQVSAEDMADRPEMQAVRRKLLEAARDYYQEFIAQHRDDPSIQAELAACHLRVATILGEIGSKADALASIERARELQENLVRAHPTVPEFLRDLGSIYHKLGSLQGSQVPLLAQKSVQEELRLTDEQVRRVTQLADARREAFRDYRHRSPDEWRQKFEELEANEKVLGDILQPAQEKRLQQVALQQRGVLALVEPEMAATLRLSDAQKKLLRVLQDQAFVSPRDVFRPGPPRPDGKKFEDVWKQTKEQMLSVLTAAQKAQWDELTGEPFHGEVRHGPSPRFGPPGPDFRRRP